MRKAADIQCQGTISTMVPNQDLLNPRWAEHSPTPWEGTGGRSQAAGELASHRTVSGCIWPSVTCWQWSLIRITRTIQQLCHFPGHHSPLRTTVLPCVKWGGSNTSSAGWSWCSEMQMSHDIEQTPSRALPHDWCHWLLLSSHTMRGTPYLIAGSSPSKMYRNMQWETKSASNMKILAHGGNFYLCPLPKVRDTFLHTIHHICDMPKEQIFPDKHGCGTFPVWK